MIVSRCCTISKTKQASQSESVHHTTGQLLDLSADNKFFFSHRNSLFYHKMHSFPLFHSFSRTLHSFSRPPHSFSSLLRSQGLWELSGSRAAEMHWFRWKEVHVLFTIAVTLLPHWTQPMAEPVSISEIPLFCKLINGDYQMATSKSDKKIASSIQFFVNNLPSFQQFKNNDNLDWVVKY